jgi:segregation and condensation protein B
MPPMTEADSGERPAARRILEALLMVADDPVPARLLAELLEAPLEEVEEHLATLAAEYRADERGFRLVEVAGGWRFESDPVCAPYVERFVAEETPSRLSPAAFETLAIVAYRQPISRAQLAAVRGVNVDSVVRQLTRRGYLAVVGRDEGPGQALLYGTTSLFLEHLGLRSLADLPPLAEMVPSPAGVEALEDRLRARLVEEVARGVPPEGR